MKKKMKEKERTNMKEAYEPLEMETIEFENADVITESEHTNPGDM